MEINTAINLLNSYKGKNLHEVAKSYNINENNFLNLKTNKGWCGQTIEKILGLSQNSSRESDFEDFELKTMPVKLNSKGKLIFKETVAITMVNERDLVNNSFYESHLFKKIKKMLCVTRFVGKNNIDPTFIHNTYSITLSKELLVKLETDYNLIRKTFIDNLKDIKKLSSKLGYYIQPRTKGSKGSTSRAFYFKKTFLNEIIELNNFNMDGLI